MLIKTKNTNYKIHFPIYLVLSVFLVFFILLTNSVNVSAATTYTLPYNINDYEGNSSTWQYFYDIFNACENYWNTSSYFSSDNAFIVIDEVRESTVYFEVFNNYEILDTSSISSIYYNQVTVKSLGNRGFIRVQADNNNGVLSNFQVAGWSDSGFTYSIFGGYNATTSYGVSFQRYYPVFANTDIYDVNGNLVIYDYAPWLPEEDVLEDFHEALNITSTLANGIDNSLTDLQNQKGFFDNLVSNLKNFFNSLNGWINNGFTFLSSTIKTFFGPLLRNIQNYLSQFKGSFDDFKDLWDHFFEIINSIYNMSIENGEFSLAKLISVLLVPSQEDLTNVFSGTPLYTLYKGIISAVSNFYTTISGVLNSNYVYVFSLPTFTFGGKTFTGLQFSFDWYIPYKTYGDAIISVFLIIAYIRFLMTFIPNFFYGSGFIDHDVNTIHGRTDSL